MGRVGDVPGVVVVLVVHTDDVVAALEARDRGRRRTVLRATPPFAPRMRARLHVEGGEGEYDALDGVDPLHVHPRSFVGDDVPRFPGRGPERWRSTVRDSLEKRVVLELDAGPRSVGVSYLG